MTAYRVPQLAARWGCSPGHVRNMIERGELRAFTIGRLVRIPAAEVERVECRGIASSACAGGSPLSGQTQTANDTADSLPRGIDLEPRQRPADASQPGAILNGPWAA